MPKTLGIVITDGVGYRNVVLSNTLQKAEKQFDEVIILSCLPKSVYEGCTATQVIELDVFQESFKTWFFRKTKEVAHLKKHQKGNFGFQDALRINRTKSKTPRGYATRLIFGLTSIFNSESCIRSYEKLQQYTFRNHQITRAYRQLLKENTIDILFFTHQRPPYIAPLILASKQLKLKSASFIFSWDNLASKGRMAGNFDKYMVWSDLMRKELLQYYSKIDDEQVAVVGTPQFEPYMLPRYAMSKDAFENHFNLNPTLPSICFSCGDVSTSRNDELYIEIISEAIEKKTIPECNFIVRTSPAEDPIRFKDLKTRFPNIIWNYPDWEQVRQGHQESWSQRVPKANDLKTLRALLEHCDLGINMLSTMTLDFFQFDKPVINTVFGNADNDLYDDQRFLKYEHIQHLVNAKATIIAKNKFQLLEAIRTYLKTPKKDSMQRKKVNQLEVGVPLEQTSKLIAKTLYNWA